MYAASRKAFPELYGLKDGRSLVPKASLKTPPQLCLLISICGREIAFSPRSACNSLLKEFHKFILTTNLISHMFRLPSQYSYICLKKSYKNYGDRRQFRHDFVQSFQIFSGFMGVCLGSYPSAMTFNVICGVSAVTTSKHVVDVQNVVRDRENQFVGYKHQA